VQTKAILGSIRMRIALGDVPTWFAFVAAVVAGCIAWSVYRIEQKRDRVTEEKELRGQADQVAAWYGIQEEGTAVVGAGVQKQPAHQYSVGAYAHNASELPVYNLVTRFYVPPPGAGPDQPEAEVPYVHHKLTLPPGDTVYFAIPEVTRFIAAGDTKLDYFGRVEIDFTDAAGNRWHRDVNGRLQSKAGSKK
jgi:hypothetical protein